MRYKRRALLTNISQNLRNMLCKNFSNFSSKYTITLKKGKILASRKNRISKDLRWPADKAYGSSPSAEMQALVVQLLNKCMIHVCKHRSQNVHCSFYKKKYIKHYALKLISVTDCFDIIRMGIYGKGKMVMFNHLQNGS